MKFLLLVCLTLCIATILGGVGIESSDGVGVGNVVFTNNEGDIPVFTNITQVPSYNLEYIYTEVVWKFGEETVPFYGLYLNGSRIFVRHYDHETGISYSTKDLAFGTYQLTLTALDEDWQNLTIVTQFISKIPIPEELREKYYHFEEKSSTLITTIHDDCFRSTVRSSNKLTDFGLLGLVGIGLWSLGVLMRRR